MFRLGTYSKVGTFLCDSGLTEALWYMLLRRLKRHERSQLEICISDIDFLFHSPKSLDQCNSQVYACHVQIFSCQIFIKQIKFPDSTISDPF